MGVPLRLNERNGLKKDLIALNKNGLNLRGIIDQEKITPKKLLDQLSQQELANWMVETAQTMLHTKDPHLTGLGKFVEQSLNNLALALMAKGAQLVIPETEQVEPTAFVKELSDLLVKKFSSLTAEEKISDEFWKGFIKDLPLPPAIKDLLLPEVIKNAASLQENLKETNSDLEEIKKVHAEAEKKILAYKGGKQLLSITEKVSDQIIEMVLEENIGLVNTFGLGDTIEELFDQFLPGVQINDELKTWFKEYQRFRHD